MSSKKHLDEDLVDILEDENTENISKLIQIYAYNTQALREIQCAVDNYVANIQIVHIPEDEIH